MFGLSGYIYLAVAVVLGLSVGGNYLQYRENQQLHETLATEKANHVADQEKAKLANDSLVKANQALRESAAENAVRMEFAQEKQRDLESANAALRANTDKWRSRLEDETYKRPKVVARAARRTINNRMRRVECITDTKCSPDSAGNPIASPAPASKGGTPSGDRASSGNAGNNKKVEQSH